MKFRILPLLVFLAISFAFSGHIQSAVVFKPGEKEKGKYVAPGDEELNGNASELFQIGQKAELSGNKKRAIRAYRTLVRRHPKDALAPSAAFLTAKLLEEVHDYPEAASSYRFVVEKYPSSPHFEEAIEGQFRIGEKYLAGRKMRLLGIPVATSMDRAVEIFAAVIRTAPYGKYTARAQFDIGLAREKQGLNDAALQAYQAVVDKFPSDPIAAEAQYQIGYIWLSAARTGTKDIAAAVNATTAFQDFLARYPNSEKAAQARSNLQSLGRKTTVSSFDVAKFYDKQRSYRAAVIYYNEVIRQQPGSPESERAKKRIDQLRAKLGDKVVEAALEANEKKKKLDANQANPKGESQSSPSSDTGGLPPPETDTALPPPASLAPDTTNSALPAPIPEATPTPNAESSPAPETTATPEEVPSTTSESSASPSP